VAISAYQKSALSFEQDASIKQYVHNVKPCPSCKAQHEVVLISVSSAFSQTPAYTARPRIRS